MSQLTPLFNLKAMINVQLRKHYSNLFNLRASLTISLNQKRETETAIQALLHKLTTRQ